MEILITESQLRVLLKEEYSEKIVQQLIDKYKLEDPSEDENTIREYINKFDKLKSNPKVEDKDIFNYSLYKLRTTLMSIFKTTDVKPKSYKGNSDLDLVYNKDNLNIYRADTRDKCITYGKGYSFCISSYSDTSSYNKYRIEESGTPYFIFNKNLDNTRIDKYNYMDPNHLLVLIVHEIGGKFYDDNENPHRHNMKSYDEYEDRKIYGDEYSMTKNVGDYYYSITNAKNPGEEYYLSFKSIAKIYPFLNGLEGIFEPAGLQGKDSALINLEQVSKVKFAALRKKYAKFMNPRFGFNDACGDNMPMFNDLANFNYAFINDLFNAAGKHEDYLYRAYRLYENHRKMSVTFNYGEDGYQVCVDEINDDIKLHNGKITTSDYEIVKCDWPEGYGDYVRDAHRLGAKLLQQRWLIEKG
jgi:hypothetical protein